jgi:hypothetical protein
MRHTASFKYTTESEAIFMEVSCPPRLFAKHRRIKSLLTVIHCKSQDFDKYCISLKNSVYLKSVIDIRVGHASPAHKRGLGAYIIGAQRLRYLCIHLSSYGCVISGWFCVLSISLHPFQKVE